MKISLLFPETDETDYNFGFFDALAKGHSGFKM